MLAYTRELNIVLHNERSIYDYNSSLENHHRVVGLIKYSEQFLYAVCIRYYSTPNSEAFLFCWLYLLLVLILPSYMRRAVLPQVNIFIKGKIVKKNW